MQRRLGSLWLLALTFAGSGACNSKAAQGPTPSTPAPTGPSAPAPGPGDVGLGGGTVTDNGVTITVPSGAVGDEITITAEAGTKVARGRYAEAGGSMVLSPAGQTFASPVSVDLPYDAARLEAEGKSPSDIIVLHRNDTTGSVTTHVPSQIDEAKKTVRVLITSFSTLQAAVPATVDATKSTIVLTPNAAVADGAETVGVVVVAKNRADELFPGASVVIAASGSQNTITQPSLPTNDDGQASGTIASALAEDKTISATVAGVAISATPSATFSSTSAPSLRITSPRPLERVPQGLPLTISWTSQRVTDTVKLSYSTDSGATYTEIANGLSANGQTTWTPPENAIRVRLKIANSLNTIEDAQAAEFTFTRVWFVSPTATGNNDGTTWADAFTQISSASANGRLRAGDQIWVSNTGTITGSGNSLVRLSRDTVLLGGFAGTETAPSQRALPLERSLLDAQNARRCFELLSGGSYKIEGFTCRDGATPDYNGGGLFAVNAAVELSHMEFNSCSATTNGGAMFLDGDGHATIENTQFVDNNAGTHGGALYGMASNQAGAKRITIVNSSFTGNFSGFGGAIALASRNLDTGSLIARVEHCTFSNNEANWDGGAIFVLQLQPTVIDCTFDQNSANYSGGALYSLLSDLRLSRSVFTRNTAGTGRGAGEYGMVYGGGALMIDEPKGTKVERNRFLNNQSLAGGGGVSVRGVTVAEFKAELTNNVIAKNTASFSGGGIMLGATANADLRFNTITGNVASNVGPGIGTMSDVTLGLYSSIVWGNEAQNLDLQSYQNGSYFLTAETSNVSPALANNISADPNFVDSANDDYRLQSGSVCINAGTALNAPDVDYAGTSRGSQPDIGAYEFQ